MIAKLLTSGGLCLALAGCFQTSLTGTTGATTVTVAPLRDPGNTIGEYVTRTEGDWISILGAETWEGYARLVQLLFLGTTSALDTSTIDPNALYLLTATGGEDYFSQATSIDPGQPEPVQGTWHAITTGQRLIEGYLQISVLSEASYRQAASRLGQLSDQQLLEQLDAAARLMVSDVDNDGSVDHNDILAWNPRLHGPRYRGDLLDQEALAEAIRANQPAASLDTLAQAVLGSHRVVIETNFGTITMDTLNWETPVTVDNFLNYVESGFYEDIIFHRVIRNFVIQAGLLTYDIDTQVFDDPTPGSPIRNESRWSISNTRGTVAMARTSDPDSATAQFYINQVDNTDLDFPNFGGGYAVFAVLENGLDVVDSMANVPTTFFSGLADFPRQLIQIESATIEN
ncbi:MAG: peptidylprolyl isomerase [Halieaceae bacterium]|nr:peptidylprolyl isomerase [Halieaceae bacterium]